MTGDYEFRKGQLFKVTKPFEIISVDFEENEIELDTDYDMHIKIPLMWVEPVKGDE